MNTRILIITLAILTTVACSDQKIEKYIDQRDPVKVQVAVVSSKSDSRALSIDGTVTSDNVVDISAKIMGYVEQLTLDPGDRVAKGRLIARIKNDESNTRTQQIEAMIDEAQVNLNAIQKDHDRIERLIAQNSATQKELDDITTQLDVTKARLKQLESSKREAGIMNSYSDIIAPISGNVVAKYLDNGEMAAPGHPIITIASGGDQVIRISVPENYINRISKKTEVFYKNSEDQDWKEGSITEINTSAMYGQYEAKIGLPGETSYLDGMYMRVRIPMASKANSQTSNEGIRVPKNAIIERGQLTGIFVPSDQNTALLRWVTLGETSGDEVEILSGLAPGERFILDANSRLMNGVPITL